MILATVTEKVTGEVKKTGSETGCTVIVGGSAITNDAGLEVTDPAMFAATTV
ncbi:MAG: hypothetical protein ACHQ5A_04915 [Opitutales bacterium]